MDIPATPIRYDVDLAATRTHQVRVSMTADLPGAEPLDVALPFMSPGSPVNSRNHPAQLGPMQVRDAAGNPLPYEKLPEGGWRIERHARGPVTVSYTLNATDFSSARDQLSDDHAYLNGAATFMYVKGHDRDLSAVVNVHDVPRQDWTAVSTLPPLTAHPNAWYAVNFQELADSNIEIGPLDVATRTVDGLRITVAQHGHSPWARVAPDGVSPQQNVADFGRIYRAFEHELGDFPKQRAADAPATPAGVESPDRYTIIKHYVSGEAPTSLGLEHYHGHELTFVKGNEEGIHRVYADNARMLENKVMAHELGHRLLAKYVQHAGIDSSDFSHEHPSDGLWLTEGVTEWLGTVLERRAGLITEQQYLDRLENQINRCTQDFAVRGTNAREDSLEAANGDGDYYMKGAVLGAMLDLEILHLTDGKKSFMDVLRGLKRDFGGTGQGHTLDDVRRIAREVVADVPGAAATLDSVFQDVLVDRKPIDFNRFLAHAGLRVTERADAWPVESLDLGEGSRLVTDPRGVPHTVAAASAVPALPPFRTLLPALGVSLERTLEGKLKIGVVTPGGSAYAAGLKDFEGATLEGLQPDPTGLTFKVKKHDLFSGEDRILSIPVTARPATRLCLERLPRYAAADALRGQWLQASTESAPST